MSPAELFAQEHMKAICDEVAQTLDDVDFLSDKDWRQAFEIAARYIKYKMYQEVSNGLWVHVGIPADLSYLRDLTVIVERSGSGVHMGIKMPTVMAIIHKQDDPNVN